MSKMDEDQLIPVPAAIEAITGERPCPSACYRYVRRGVAGQVLQCWYVGQRRLTSIAAARKWIDAVTAAKLNREPASVGASSCSDSDDFLNAEGV
jgi:hypothetical protein